MLTIRVRPTCSVLDMHPHSEYEVEPSDIIELLIKTGKLIWVEEPLDGGYQH